MPARDQLRIAGQKADGIDVMDRVKHDVELVGISQPGPHVPRGLDRNVDLQISQIADEAAINDLLRRRDPAGPAHLLVDRRLVAHSRRRGDYSARLYRVECEWLLAQDVLAGADAANGEVRLRGRVDGDVDNRDLRIDQQLIDRFVDARDTVCGRGRKGSVPVQVIAADNLEDMPRIGRQMRVVDDTAAADQGDAVGSRTERGRAIVDDGESDRHRA